MTFMTTLPQSRPLTEDDLASLPEDGHRYELLDGSLIVTPAPVTRHQALVVGLAVRLVAACPRDFKVFTAPLDVRLAEDTVLQPDVLVCRRSDLTERNLPASPVLAVEVLSPSTRLIDLNLKRARYEAAGCPAYWAVDPDGPTLRSWLLLDGTYAEQGPVSGEAAFETSAPFEVSFRPVDLLD